MLSKPADPVFCASCDARFAVEQVSENVYQTLIDQHYWHEFSDELRMLERVKDFYTRHPEAEGTIRPHFAWVLDSDDPEVIEELCYGAPFDQIRLPPEHAPLPPEVVEAEAQVIDYLRHHDFVLGPRLAFVREQVGRLGGNLNPVACPSCRTGWLRLDLEAWQDPHTI